MNFSAERFVRIYPTVTASGRLMGFWGRVLLDQLVKVADPAGVIDLPESLIEHLPSAVAAVIDCSDVNFVEVNLPKLTDTPDPSVVFRKPNFLIIPRYIEGQYCITEKSTRDLGYKVKKAAFQRAIDLGLLDDDGQLATAS